MFLDMTYGMRSQVFYLAELLCQVIGSDSPGLLKVAREKVKKQNIDLILLMVIMLLINLGKFGSVITNAIGHLIKNNFELAIKNIYKNLKDNGIYIFDILNLDEMTDETIKSDIKRMTGKRTVNDRTTICNIIGSTSDRGQGCLTKINNYRIKTTRKRN